MCLNYEEHEWFTGIAQSDFTVVGLETQTALLVTAQAGWAAGVVGVCFGLAGR